MLTHVVLYQEQSRQARYRLAGGAASPEASKPPESCLHISAPAEAIAPVPPEMDSNEANAPDSASLGRRRGLGTMLNQKLVTDCTENEPRCVRLEYRGILRDANKGVSITYQEVGRNCILSAEDRAGPPGQNAIPSYILRQ